MAWLIISGPIAQAQKDTLRKTVDILSSFRPAIREADKLIFYPGQLNPDTTRPRFQYTIPSQQLSLGYPATALKPIAYTVDSVQRFAPHPYLKLGYGNLSTKYIKAGYTWGDGFGKSMQVNASHLSSKGKLASQQYGSTAVKWGGHRKVTDRPIRIDGDLSFLIDKLKKYGYHYWQTFYPAPALPLEDSIRQHFISLSGEVGISSTQAAETGVSFTSSLGLVRFSDRAGNAETQINAVVPVQKMIDDDWRVNMALSANWTQLNGSGRKGISNTMVSLTPSIRHWTDKFSIQVGVLPVWTNQDLRVLPSICAALNSVDKKVTLQAGWEGSVVLNNYQSFATKNPWIWVPAKLSNTLIHEKYLGIRASWGNHGYAGFKGGYAVLNNMPLFVNDTTEAGQGNSFQMVYEDRLRRVQIKGEAGYQIADRFQLNAVLIINQYGGQQSQSHPWGLVPLELNSSLRIALRKDLWLKTDFFAWRGSRFLLRNGKDERLQGAVDLNTSLEYKVTKSVQLWAQFNNLFNSTYQRWYQYPVYGFNCTAGVVISPRQKNKD